MGLALSREDSDPLCGWPIRLPCTSRRALVAIAMNDWMWPHMPWPDSWADLRVQIGESAGATAVFVAGELDMTNTAPLVGVLDMACSLAGNYLVVDVSELAFIDVVGMRVLVSTHDRLLREGRGGIVVRGAAGPVRRVFGLTGFASLLDDSPQEPREHLSARVSGSGRELENGRRSAGLSLKNLFAAYLALGGTADFAGMVAHLKGAAEVLDAHQRDVAAHALNECLADLGRTEHLLSYAADQGGLRKGPE